MSEGPQREEIQQAIDRTVEELFEANGISEPPVDALALARHLGIIGPHQVQPSRPRRGGRREQPSQHESSEEQEQWVAAHAIGEHLRPELLRSLDLDPEQRGGFGGASLVNLFADSLLLPARWSAAEGRLTGYDLAVLKQRFRTASHERIAWRLLDLPEPCIITIIDNDHVVKRRSNAYHCNRELADPEKRCQRYVHQYSRPHEVREESWRVQGWPIHRVDWKREVLRSVVEE